MTPDDDELTPPFGVRADLLQECVDVPAEERPTRPDILVDAQPLATCPRCRGAKGWNYTYESGTRYFLRWLNCAKCFGTGVTPRRNIT